MHLTLKLATASPPASNRREQQRWFDRFREEYNQERPQEGKWRYGEFRKEDKSAGVATEFFSAMR
jgi:hypothetical protein